MVVGVTHLFLVFGSRIHIEFKYFFFQAEDGIRDRNVTGVQTCALQIFTLGAMAACAVVGILIERLAYRPVRHHARLTSLITAIGVSLLLEYGGQVVFGATPRFFPQKIGRASCRERV